MTTTDKSGHDAAQDDGLTSEDRLPANDEVTLRDYQAIVDDWIRTVGVRYYTGLGPIRLDLAVPLNKRAGDPDYALYVGIGQAF